MGIFSVVPKPSRLSIPNLRSLIPSMEITRQKIAISFKEDIYMEFSAAGSIQTFGLCTQILRKPYVSLEQEKATAVAAH